MIKTSDNNFCSNRKKMFSIRREREKRQFSGYLNNDDDEERKEEETKR